MCVCCIPAQEQLPALAITTEVFAYRRVSTLQVTACAAHRIHEKLTVTTLAITTDVYDYRRGSTLQPTACAAHRSVGAVGTRTFQWLLGPSPCPGGGKGPPARPQQTNCTPNPYMKGGWRAYRRATGSARISTRQAPRGANSPRYRLHITKIPVGQAHSQSVRRAREAPFVALLLCGH